MSTTYDIAIIGGGIVGLATAMALTGRGKRSLVVLEAEDHVAAHQTGHNSGVIHSGIYYKPGSLKAKNCVSGRLAMYDFCQKYGIAVENCGKLIVATLPQEIAELDKLEKRGIENGLKGMRRLKGEQIKEVEPHTAGLEALQVRETGIVDYIGVSETYARLIKEAGGEIKTKARVTGFHAVANEFVLDTPQGEIHCRNLINCAGLYSDRVAKMCGVEPGLQIIPFRGEYYDIVPERQFLVKNLIYPVPDPNFPFLGVHFTRMVKGGVEAGPNAVLAFKREGYSWTFSPRDTLQFSTYSGFWAMAAKHWKMGFGEIHRSLSKPAFVKALQRLLPELRVEDVHRSGAGVRAQALEPNGKLSDDFKIKEAPHMVHVLNAPSPAATASISIGISIADTAQKNFS